MTTFLVHANCDISRTSWHMKVNDGLFFRIFQGLSFEPCTKFELNWLRNKNVMEKIRESKLEMASYSDYAYDVANFLLF